MDDNYIEFELNNKKLKINKEDSNDIEWWYWTNGGGKKLKNPYWRKLKLKEDKGYFRIWVNKNYFQHHRVVYYAHNKNWDIHHEPLKNVIDHEDHNPRNNHISNLRVGDASLNQQNQQNVKGYSLDKQSKKYRAQIKINGKTIHLGSYKKEEDARNAYLDAKPIYHKWNLTPTKQPKSS